MIQTTMPRPQTTPPEAASAVAATSVAPAVRTRRLSRAAASPSQAGDPLTIEHVVGFDSPREFRLHPRERSVAYTAESAGARQLFVLPLRGGSASQLTASEKSVSDPQWSPDGRRLAFLRDGAVWVMDRDGSRLVRVTEHPAGNALPRWAPDGRRLAFVSRRRGWSQVWVIDAPVPRRGRPAAHPRPAEPSPATPPGLDVDDYVWSPDGNRIALAAQREEFDWASVVSVVDLVTGAEVVIAPGDAWECGPRWLPDGDLLLASDADGWIQVVRIGADGRRTALTTGAREHGEPSGGVGHVALPAPGGERFVYPEVHDGVVDLLVGSLGASTPPKRGRGRPPRQPRPVSLVTDAVAINPWPGRWHPLEWASDGAWVVAVGESERRPQDLWLLPVPGVAPVGARARQITESLPVVLRNVHWAAGERVRFVARDGLPIEGNLFRPAVATGKRGGTAVPTVVFLHGGPVWQSYLSWSPIRQLLVHEGFAVLDVDFRGSTGYGRDFRRANRDEWGHADVFDCIDAGRWAAGQPWSNGNLVVHGGSYGGYLTLCALVEEPAMWRAGVDLYGDSEIAESFRHGDRPGRLDLLRIMGDPEDAARVAVYRRGSPLYRAERIEAPLLMLHGRRDKRVVPLMTEKMAEALSIEDKFHEVHWYDDEAHGWVRRENRRDALTRIVAFLRRHALDVAPNG